MPAPTLEFLGLSLALLTLSTCPGQTPEVAMTLTLSSARAIGLGPRALSARSLASDLRVMLYCLVDSVQLKAESIPLPRPWLKHRGPSPQPRGSGQAWAHPACRAQLFSWPRPPAPSPALGQSPAFLGGSHLASKGPRLNPSPGPGASVCNLFSSSDLRVVLPASWSSRTDRSGETGWARHPVMSQ